MLNILALETSTEACSVALSQSNVIASRYEIAPRQHAKCLYPMVEDLLLSSGVTIKEIDLITYGIGPGSFTGLRIAASAAQALAYALKIRAFGGCTLECQALEALQNQIIGVNDAVLSVMDAKIKKVFWSLVLFKDGHPITVIGPGVTSVSEFPWSHIVSFTGDKNLQVVGDAADLVCQDKSIFDKIKVTCFKDIRPHAKALLESAMLAHQRDQLQDAKDINPLYLGGASRFRKMLSVESA